MPTGSTEEHEYWCSKDPDGDGDRAAMRFLGEREYKLTDRHTWILPPGKTRPDEEETKAMRYLIQEWDFDGYEDPNA